MAEKRLASKALNSIFHTIPYLTQFPTNRYWVDYDSEVDVLYISFERPQDATDSEMLKDGVILRLRKKKVVGITILEASKRRKFH